jgi:hypothetical protein
LLQHVSGILESNNIRVQGRDKENPKIEFIAKSMMKMQNDLFQANKNNKQISIQELIDKIKPEIEAEFGD